MQARRQSVHAALVVRGLACIAVLALPAARGDPGDTVCFTLNVGTAGDDDPNRAMHLDFAPGDVSPAYPVGHPDWRDIYAGGAMRFHLKASALPAAIPLDAHGVPRHDAIVEIEFEDTFDEDARGCTLAGDPHDYTACRPALWVRLDDDRDPGLAAVPDWRPVLGLGGLADGAAKTAQVFLERCPFQLLRALYDDALAEDVFTFRIQCPTFGGYALPIDKIQVSFPVHDDFLAEREADRDGPFLGRLDYEDDGFPRYDDNGAELDPSAFPGQKFVVYARPCLARIFPGTNPRPGEPLDPSSPATLTAFDVAGEAEPVTFAVYALEDLTDLTVTVSALTCDQDTIVPEKIDVAVVQPMDKRWGAAAYYWVYGAQGGYLDGVPAGGVTLPAGDSRQFWITIDCPIPPHNPATYRGTITVLAGDHAVAIPIELTVYDVTLAERAAAEPVFLFAWPYWEHAYFGLDPDTTTAALAAHQICPEVNVRGRVWPVQQDGQWSALVAFDEEFADQLDAYAELLPPTPRARLNLSDWGLWAACDCPMPDDETRFHEPCPVFDAVWTDVLRQIRQAFTGRGLGEPMVTGRDEPGEKYTSRRPSNYCYRLAREAGLKTWVTYDRSCEKPLAGYEFALSAAQGAEKLTLELAGLALPLQDEVEGELRRITFSVHDQQKESDASGETRKRLVLIGGDPPRQHVVWEQYLRDYPFQLVSCDLRPYVEDGELFSLQFEFRSQHAGQTEPQILLYFMEYGWRNAAWELNVSPNWSLVSLTPDQWGYLGPMGPNLDERVHSASDLTAETILGTTVEGDTLSYYTTAACTQNVPVNNRFLHGVYAAAIGAASVSPYGLGGWHVPYELSAFGLWGPVPYDDLEAWPDWPSDPDDVWAGRRHGGYELVMPSWEDRVHATVPFEMMREGIEDSRIIAALRAELARPDALQPEADNIQAWLDNLWARPSRECLQRYLHIDMPWDMTPRVLADLGRGTDDYGVFDRIRLHMIFGLLALRGAAFWGPQDDCNRNGVPDEYIELESDCNANGIPDECDLAACLDDPACDDCNANGIPDECDLAACLDDPACDDCNGNGVPDACDIAAGTSADGELVPDGVPDECQPLWCRGDMNCSRSSPHFDDIDFFSAAVSGESAWRAFYLARTGKEPCCPWLLGDFSVPSDGVDYGDIEPFAESICQPCQVYGP